jgi:hypothetical protein
MTHPDASFNETAPRGQGSYGSGKPAIRPDGTPNLEATYDQLPPNAHGYETVKRETTPGK